MFRNYLSHRNFGSNVMKFYVLSGKAKYTCVSPVIDDPKTAAIEALRDAHEKNVPISYKTIVSERGLDISCHKPDEDLIFDTRTLLIEGGIL
jgi:hypothetical protein